MRRPAIKRALVVEDDQVLCGAICGALSDAGFDTVGCADLGAARASIQQLMPHVIVLDLSLGPEFGGELLEELAREERQPEVIVCSAFPLATLVAARFSVRCVNKPFDLQRLLDEIEDALGQRRARDRAQSA